MTLFITGSEGFIGQRLCNLCDERGIEYVRFDKALGHDVLDIIALETIIPEDSVVVHLAAMSTVKACELEPVTAVKVNITGTANVIRAAHRCGASQAILASTEWVYDGTDGPLIEDAELAPQTHYGRTKAQAERLMEATDTGVLMTVLRLGIVYGPRKEPGSAPECIARDIRDTRRSAVRSAESARCYIHVDDLCVAVLAAQGHDGVFNITGDELLTLGRIQMTAAGLVRDHTALISNGNEIPSIRNVPNDKAKRELSWAPKIGLEAGLRSLMVGP